MSNIQIVSTELWEHEANPSNVQKLSYVSDIDGYNDTAYIMPQDNRKLWIINLHGHGSLGDQIFTRADVREYRLKPILKAGVSLVTSDLRKNSWMCPEAANDLHSLITWLKAEFNAESFVIDAGSMGGTGSLIYSVLYPEDITAVSAFCPATDVGRYHDFIKDDGRAVCQEITGAIRASYKSEPEDNPELYKKHSACENFEHLQGKPARVIHGDNDALIPVTESRSLAEKMANSKNFEYIEVKDGTHDSVLADGNLIDFLNKHGLL